MTREGGVWRATRGVGGCSSLKLLNYTFDLRSKYSRTRKLTRRKAQKRTSSEKKRWPEKLEGGRELAMERDRDSKSWSRSSSSL